MSYSTNAGHTATISSSTLPAPVATGTLTFNLASITGAAGATFDINLVARALNIAGNTNGLS